MPPSLPNPDFIQLGFDDIANAANPRVSIGANTDGSGGALPFRFFARPEVTELVLRRGH